MWLAAMITPPVVGIRSMRCQSRCVTTFRIGFATTTTVLGQNPIRLTTVPPRAARPAWESPSSEIMPGRPFTGQDRVRTTAVFVQDDRYARGAVVRRHPGQTT